LGVPVELRLREPPFLSFGSCFPRRAGGSQSTTPLHRMVRQRDC